MTAKVKVIEATANSDFDAIRQVYYVTWQDAYHGLISDDFLAQLSPASWHPERRWQDTLLQLMTKIKLLVFAALVQRGCRILTAGVSFIQFMCCRSFNIQVSVLS